MMIIVQSKKRLITDCLIFKRFLSGAALLPAMLAILLSLFTDVTLAEGERLVKKQRKAGWELF